MEIMIAQAVLRTFFAFIFVLMLARIMGRKLISQMTFFDFVVGVTLGSATASLSLGPNSNFITAATVLAILTLSTLSMGFIHIKSRKFQKLIDSEPLILIANGEIIEENLKRARTTLNELLMLLREKNIFNIANVEYAILETDGKLSVLLKSQKLPVTPSDLNLATSYIGLTKDLVMDGEIMYENLQDSHLDERWLEEQLAQRGIISVTDVFYAGLDTAGHLYLSLKRKNIERHGKYGIE